MTAQPLELAGYQKRAAKFVLTNHRCMLALDPGLGKTAATLAAFLALHKRAMAKRLLVIAPLNPAKMVWRQEVTKWQPFAHLSVSLIVGTAKQREQAVAANTDIDVINYENVEWLIRTHGHCPYDMIVLDESTLIKSPSSKRRRALLPWTNQAQWLVELTGTPTPRSLEDLWAQMHTLDGGRALGEYVTHFRAKYFDPVIKSGHQVHRWAVKPGCDVLIHEAVQHLILRMDAEEYLELPPYVFRDIDVELPPKARKQYQSMEREMFAELDQGESIAMDPASARNRCHQMVGGGLYQDDRQRDEYWHLHDAKTDALKDLLESLQGEPVLVAIQFRHELERVSRACEQATGVKPPAVVGRSKVQVEQLQDEWNMGLHPVVIVHPASLSHGANLQDAGIGVCWYSMTDNLEHYDQLNRRLRRRNRVKPVFVWHIRAVKTVDEAIIARGGEKALEQAGLLSFLLAYRRRVCLY